jgi:hypothetical protein
LQITRRVSSWLNRRLKKAKQSRDKRSNETMAIALQALPTALILSCVHASDEILGSPRSERQSPLNCCVAWNSAMRNMRAAKESPPLHWLEASFNGHERSYTFRSARLHIPEKHSHASYLPKGGLKNKGHPRILRSGAL